TGRRPGGGPAPRAGVHRGTLGGRGLARAARPRLPPAAGVRDPGGSTLPSVVELADVPPAPMSPMAPAAVLAREDDRGSWRVVARVVVIGRAVEHRRWRGLSGHHRKAREPDGDRHVSGGGRGGRERPTDERSRGDDQLLHLFRPPAAPEHAMSAPVARTADATRDSAADVGMAP